MSPHDPQTTEQLIKTTGDVLSASVVLATLMQWLPAVAAFLTVVWTIIRIFETQTVQELLARVRGK